MHGCRDDIGMKVDKDERVDEYDQLKRPVASI